jgi:ribonuclease P protein component
VKLQTIKKRSIFEKLNKNGIRVSTKGLVLQSFCFSGEENSSALSGPIFGFTATKKTGNAVVRNRSKRKLRAAVREILKSSPSLFKPDYYYVLIAKNGSNEREQDALLKDLKYALHNIDKPNRGL